MHALMDKSGTASKIQDLRVKHQISQQELDRLKLYSSPSMSKGQFRDQLENNKMSLYQAIATLLENYEKMGKGRADMEPILAQLQTLLESEAMASADEEVTSVATHASSDLQAAWRAEVAAATGAADAAVLEAEHWRSEADLRRAELLSMQHHAELGQKSVLQLQERLARSRADVEAAQQSAEKQRQLHTDALAAAEDLRAQVAELQHKLQMERKIDVRVLVTENEALQRARDALQHELQAANKAACAQREQLQHEVNSWRLAANQTTSVAEKAQGQVQLLDQRLAAAVATGRERAEQVEQLRAEMLRVRKELDDNRRQLDSREELLAKLETSVLLPLLRWHADSVAAAAVKARKADKSIAPVPGLPAEITMTHVPQLAGAVEMLLGRVEHYRRMAQEQTAATAQEREWHKARFQEDLQDAHKMLKAAKQEVQEGAEKLRAEQGRTAALEGDVRRLRDECDRTHAALDSAGKELVAAKQRTEEQLKELKRLLVEEGRDKAAAAHEKGRQAGSAEAQERVKSLQSELLQAQRRLSEVEKELELALHKLGEAEGQCDQLRSSAQEARRAHERALLQASQEAAAQLHGLQAQLEQYQVDASRKLMQERTEWEERLQQLRADHREDLHLVDNAMKAAIDQERQAAHDRLQQHSQEAEQRLDAAQRSAAMQLATKVAVLEAELMSAEQHRQDALQQERTASNAMLREALSAAEQALKEARQAAEHKLKGTVEELLAKWLAEKADIEAAHSKHVADVEAYQQDQAAAVLAETRQQYNEVCGTAAALREQVQTLEQTVRMVNLQAHDGGGRLADAVAECAGLRSQLEQERLAVARLAEEVEQLHGALEQQKAAAGAAETAAQEAWHSASAAGAAVQEQAALARSLQEQMRDMETMYANEVAGLEERARSAVEAAQAQVRSELQAAQAKLQRLRQKQSRVMALVDSVVASPDQTGSNWLGS